MTTTVVSAGHVGQHGGDPVGVPAVVHQRHEVRVAEQVPQLVLDVPVVDVDRHRAALVRRDQGLDELDRVARVDADVVASADAALGQVVR